ncbi:hypothetical protein CIHG_02155 [Coccidioides immitis H538.4]|uniref:Uncharacterized protein n=2 Tax=Coccidioides immitis TaxID=5501 RepID=A0A0J8RGS8_COCIT|nr:hypothetical protein CIRG_00326 [Coccidioides immitis RMSCC 2394]KMU84370.1 hypothetical protein CIHG_02155 [Coccidioides immitis H538.4]
MADRKRFLSFMRTKGLQSLTGRNQHFGQLVGVDNQVVCQPSDGDLPQLGIGIGGIRSDECELRIFSIMINIAISPSTTSTKTASAKTDKPPDNEVYVAAGAIPKNKRDNEIKKTCEKKCREIHRERVSKCEGLKDGKDKCLKSAALLGSDKGQKQCVVPCVASIFGPHKGGLFADFYS